MRLLRFYHSEFPDRRKAFSLIELMIAVSLTVFIIIALYSVFNVTQKALRSAVKQVAVRDMGAPALELIAAELETSLAWKPYDPNSQNFHTLATPLEGVTQVGPDNNPVRTNVTQELYFLRRDKQQWIATMYKLEDLYIVDTNTGGERILQAGTLTRFVTNLHASVSVTNALLPLFDIKSGRSLKETWSPSQWSAVAERVIHFKVTTFDAEGRPYTVDPSTNYVNGITNISGTEYRVFWTDSQAGGGSNVFTSRAVRPNGNGGNTTVDEVIFKGRAMPASVEIEIGILDPENHDQYRLLALDQIGAPPTNQDRRYLRERPQAVHMFRKRIPIASGQRDERLVVSN